MATPRSMRVMMLINAVDRATAIINKLSANAVARLGTIQRSSEQLARRAGDMGRQWGTAAMVMAAPLALAADQAIKFEEAMADVRKVTNLKRGTAEFAAMEKSVQRTAIAIGDMPTKVADMYAQLAQGGVAVGDLERIANVASRVAVAFDIDPSVAGDKFIKMQNALGATIDVTESVADAINYLSNNSAAKASQILDYLGAGGASVAKALNITGHESAALGSVFISMGKSGEESATIIERMTKALRNQNRVSGQIFTRAGGGMAGVMAAIEYGRKLSGQARFQFFREFGEYGIQVEQFANNFDLLNKQLGMVSDTQKYAGSVNQEFANRMDTTAKKIGQAKAQASVMAIKLGNALLPIIVKVLEVVTPLVERLAAWIDRNPELTATIVKVAAGAVAFAVAMSGAAFMISAVSTALKLMAMVAATNPILLFIMVIAGAAYYIYSEWGGIVPFFAHIWDSVVLKFQNTIDWFANIGNRSMYQTGVDIFSALGRGLWAGITLPLKPINYVLDKLNLLPSWAGGSKSVSINAGSFAGSNMAGKIANMGGIDTKPQGLSNITTGGINNITKNAGGSVTFAPTINVASGSESDRAAVEKQIRDQYAEFERMMKRYGFNNTRLSY